MKTSHSQSDQANYAFTFPKIVLFFALFLLAGASGIHAQQQVDAAQMGLKWALSDPLPGANGSSHLILKLGSPAQPLSNVSGFDIYLNFDAGVTLPKKENLDFSQSWLFTSLADSFSFSSDGQKHKILLHFEASSPRQGFGELLRINLPANWNNQSIQKLVVSGGGLISVVDIGFKNHPTGLESAGDEVAMYPNPCAGNLTFAWNGGIPEQIQFLDMQGRQAVEFWPESNSVTRISVEMLPPGLYFVRMTYGSGRVQTQRLRVK